MTVKEMIEKLQTFDETLEVMAIDGTCNVFEVHEYDLYTEGEPAERLVIDINP
jgi:hypothetical protein